MPKYTATNLEQANASGAIAYAAWLLDNYPREYARAQLRDAFVDADSSLITAVLGDAQRRVDAGNRLENLDPDQALAERSHPVNPLLPSSCEYRYRATVNWVDETTGRNKSFDASVCVSRRMTQEEIREAVIAAAGEAIGENDYGLNSFFDVEPEDFGITYITAERRG